MRRAILLVLIGGWWLLPVTRYGPNALGPGFPWWVTGIALPSDMLLTKAWIAPVAAFAGAIVRDGRSLLRWRPSLIDVPMLCWCLWPLVGAWGAVARPDRTAASLYLAGSWGLAWLIGRVWLADADGRRDLLAALGLSGLASVPVAIVEGFRGPFLYRLIYGPHPFQNDGIDRYIGFRPLGFFENGNLYGLWAALAALTACWLARFDLPLRRRWTVVAAIDVAVLLASQSAGAIALFFAGVGLLWLTRQRYVLPLLAAASAAVFLLLAVHLSGIIPLQSLAKTSLGQEAIAAMRSIGRGSFLWRLSQDSKTLATVAAHPLVGTAHWDWWRPYGARPWGQFLLIVGQFGLIGIALAWGSLLSACAATLIRLRRATSDAIEHSSAPLAVIVLLTLIDALLNAFFFSPAIVAAGAIAVSSANRRQSDG